MNITHDFAHDIGDPVWIDVVGSDNPKQTAIPGVVIALTIRGETRAIRYSVVYHSGTDVAEATFETGLLKKRTRA